MAGMAYTFFDAEGVVKIEVVLRGYRGADGTGDWSLLGKRSIAGATESRHAELGSAKRGLGTGGGAGAGESAGPGRGHD